jgi:Na+/H+-dicarboxylate symporter
MPSPSFAKNLEARDVHKTRRAKGARLVWLARVATFASCAMLVWVAFLPGSCSPFAARTRARETDASFLSTAQRIVPKTLITKYAVEEKKNGGRLACVTHVLPSAAWSALAPFQLGAFFFPKGK